METRIPASRVEPAECSELAAEASARPATPARPGWAATLALGGLRATAAHPAVDSAAMDSAAAGPHPPTLRWVARPAPAPPATHSFARTTAWVRRAASRRKAPVA